MHSKKSRTITFVQNMNMYTFKINSFIAIQSIEVHTLFQYPLTVLTHRMIRTHSRICDISHCGFQLFSWCSHLAMYPWIQFHKDTDCYTTAFIRATPLLVLPTHTQIMKPVPVETFAKVLVCLGIAMRKQ